MSTISFSMLSGAGVVEGSEANGKYIYMHTTYDVPVQKDGDTFYAEVDSQTRDNDVVYISKAAPVYGVVLDNAGGVKSYLSAIKLDEVKVGAKGDFAGATALTQAGKVEADAQSVFFTLASDSNYQGETDAPVLEEGDVVRIDCYTVHSDGATEINIDAESFGGYYYIEASTLFRDEATGKDFPAEFVIPRGKIQSNFTFSMASTGDPSTSWKLGVAA